MAQQTVALEERGELNQLRADLTGASATDVIAVTQAGKPVLAVLSWEAYESLVETVEVLSNPEAMAGIRASTEEIARSETVPWEQVKAELGLT